MSPALTPRVRVLLVCDDIQPSEDEENVFHLWGTRYQMFADAFPVWCQLRVFLIVSHVHPGRYPAYVSVIDERAEESLFDGRIVAEFSEDGGYCAFDMPVSIEFPSEGRYWVQVAFGSDVRSAILKKEEPFHVRATEE